MFRYLEENKRIYQSHNKYLAVKMVFYQFKQFLFQAVKLEACSLITELCDAKCNEGQPVSQLRRIWHYVNFLQTPEVWLDFFILQNKLLLFFTWRRGVGIRRYQSRGSRCSVPEHCAHSIFSKDFDAATLTITLTKLSVVEQDVAGAKSMDIKALGHDVLGQNVCHQSRYNGLGK